MKSVFHKVLCYLLASLVFVSSTGFGLVEHSCLVSGKKELLTGDKPCCSGKMADRSPHFSGHSAQL
ncbi:MAG: hypothetical protein H7Z75_12745, partial [Ferruginibacter sp.]|nr:hypothetical protein [Cytophagales bacterium]